MSGNRSLDEFAEPDPEEGADGRRTGEGAAAETASEETATGENAAEAKATGENVAAETADEAASEGVEVVPGGPADAEESATPDANLNDSEPATDSDLAEVEADDDRRGAPAPPASTYVWRPGGGACADCGETVEERWRDGDDLVCAECKEW